jgi:hypothetical protein
MQLSIFWCSFDAAMRCSHAAFNAAQQTQHLLPQQGHPPRPLATRTLMKKASRYINAAEPVYHLLQQQRGAAVPSHTTNTANNSVNPFTLRQSAHHIHPIQLIGRPVEQHPPPPHIHMPLTPSMPLSQ